MGGWWKLLPYNCLAPPTATLLLFWIGFNWFSILKLSIFNSSQIRGILAVTECLLVVVRSSQLDFGNFAFFVVLFWCFETNKTVRMSVLLSLCGSVIMSLHWRKVSSGWFTVLDLRFIYRTAAHSPQLDWIGQQSIRYLESTGSNLRYPPLPTLVWVWWGCILRLEVFTWGRCDKAHWSSLGLFWMGSLWQLWTMQFTAWLKPHDSGVWRENNRLK